MENNQNEKINDEPIIAEGEPEETASVQQSDQAVNEEAVNQEATDAGNRKKVITIVVICSICVLLALAVGALFFLKGGLFGNTESQPDSVSNVYKTTVEEIQEDTGSSKNKNSSKKKTSKVSSSDDEEYEYEEEEESQQGGSTEDKVTLAQSSKPEVTIAVEVAPNICIVGGSCPEKTEYVTVRGDGVTETRIVPYTGDTDSRTYFIGQVKYTKSGYIQVTATEKGKAESKVAKKYAGFMGIEKNLMTDGEYYPVIGLNSRSHFYSALLSYSLTTEKLTSDMRSKAQSNIADLVGQANAVGAETIFLIIPSSAEIYPETIPEGYPKANGETLYQAFEKIATSAGAKVIYPKDRMLSHKNDGAGYQIYQNTDSHWSAYGSYWGTYDMLEYIAGKYPAARPRTVEEMEFYTLEMNAGDVVFNLPASGFDTDRNSGITKVTGMREFTNMYYLNVRTLDTIYHNSTGLYLTWHNAAAKTLQNRTPDGLPNAVIMRDSFGKVAYDMLSDRFATTCWGEFDNYNMPEGWQDTDPDYVIHLYSERNLLKLMLRDSNATILNLR